MTITEFLFGNSHVDTKKGKFWIKEQQIGFCIESFGLTRKTKNKIHIAHKHTTRSTYTVHRKSTKS